MTASASAAAEPLSSLSAEEQGMFDMAERQFGLKLVMGQKDPHTGQQVLGYGLRCFRTVHGPKHGIYELVATVPGATMSHRDVKTDPRFKGLRYTLKTTGGGAQFVFHYEGYEGALDEALSRNFTFSWGDDAAFVAVPVGPDLNQFKKMSVAQFKAEYGTHLCGYDAATKELDMDRTTHLIMMHDAAIAMANDAAFNARPDEYADVSDLHNNVECLPYVHFVATHNFEDARFAGTMKIGPGLVALANRDIPGTTDRPVDIFTAYGASNGR